MTAFHLTHRKVTGKERASRKCSVPDCNHSAPFVWDWLGSYRDHLCRKHAKEWAELYDSALCNWQVEAHELAEQFRNAKEAA